MEFLSVKKKINMKPTTLPYIGTKISLGTLVNSIHKVKNNDNFNIEILFQFELIDIKLSSN